MNKISSFSDCLFREGIISVSVYLASTLNLAKRSEEELLPLFSAFEHLFCDLLPPVCQESKVRVCIAGCRTNFEYEMALSTLCTNTEHYQDRCIYLVLNYDPLSELERVKVTCRGLEFWNSLWVPKRLDLVFRTGGAQVLSDFLPLQSGYAQLVFVDELFNDLSFDPIQRELNRIRSLKPKYGE